VTPLVSIVIPVFNEEENLDELLARCVRACEGMAHRFEIVLVDDGSSDGSREKILAGVERYPGRIVGVFLNRNYGQHAAILAGFTESAGEVVVTLDADLQNPPEEIPRLVEAMLGGCDVVGTIRTNRHDTLFRRLSSYLTNRIVQRVTGVMMHDYGCMLRAYRREIVNAILQCREHSTFIPVLANSFARKTAEIEVGHAERSAGESKYSLWKLINLMFDLMTGTTIFPLRLLTVLGVLISLTGFLFGVLLLALRLILGPHWAVEGTFTLFAILFIFIGAQFVGLGCLGEYIGRINMDVRARPRFFVHQVVGRTAEAADSARGGNGGLEVELSTPTARQS
jgi:undecaprenyl-phosphate 4-deoxy-4-formamido-L-arabinose transferase